MKPPMKPAFVYVMSHAGRTKIGLADNVAKRLHGIIMALGADVDLHHSRMFADRNSAGIVERELHRQFQKDRLKGEWFAITPGAAIAALEAAAEPARRQPLELAELPEELSDDTLSALRHCEAMAKGYLLPEIAELWRREGIYDRNMSKPGKKLKLAPLGWEPPSSRVHG